MISPRTLSTRYYRVRTRGIQDATCFLRPAQTMGFELPDPVPAYTHVDRECRPVEIPVDDILGFEEV